MKLVHLLGVDGAGKTTAAHAAVDRLRARGVPALRVYGAYRAVLLKPAKILARRTVMRGTDQFADYGEYARAKSRAVSTYRRFGRLYAFLWMADYVAGTWMRLLPHLGRDRLLVMDRYLLDQVVNVADSAGLSDAQLLRLARRMRRLLPEPAAYVYIDLPVEAAFARKDDIPSIEYLAERRRRYLFLRDVFGFRIVDGLATPERVVEDLLAAVQAAAPPGARSGPYAGPAADSRVP